ncbi:MAG: flagellar export protein FliJ [Deltaproteobacteria bacterium]|nr:flagellar export protein FliJ [Deltaproteobacteria bacterium]
MFRFNLETLLRLRIQEEEQQLLKFSESTRMLQEEEAKLTALKEMETRYTEEYRVKQQQGVDLAELTIYRNFFRRLSQELLEQMDAIRKAQEYQGKCRQDLIDATKKKKILETLKAHQFTAWRKEQNMKETKLLDEVAITRFGK